MRVVTSIESDRPAGEVFGFVSDVRNNPRWQRGQRSCEWTSEPPLRPGSTYEQHASFAGRELVNHFEVLEVEPGRRMRFRSTGGTFPLDITRTVEPLGEERSRFTEHVTGGPGGPLRVLHPVLRPVVARTIRRDFPVLKRLLEDQAAGAASRS